MPWAESRGWSNLFIYTYNNDYHCRSNSLLDGVPPHIYITLYTLSGRTGSALVWHTRGRAFEFRLVQQVLRFVIGRVNTVQYVELRGCCPM